MGQRPLFHIYLASLLAGRGSLESADVWTVADEAPVQSQRFFALSESEKGIARRPPDRSNYRGYSGVGNEQVRDRICMKESFAVGNPNDEARPNLWLPEDLMPGFRELMEMFSQVQTQGKVLFERFASFLTRRRNAPSLYTISSTVCH